MYGQCHQSIYGSQFFWALGDSSRLAVGMDSVRVASDADSVMQLIALSVGHVLMVDRRRHCLQVLGHESGARGAGRRYTIQSLAEAAFQPHLLHR